MNRLALSAALVVASSPALAATDEGNAVMSLMLIVVMLATYFFPAIIAAFRGHHNLLAIFLLNMFLGWSGLGWVGALVWAATQVQRPFPPPMSATALSCAAPMGIEELLFGALKILIGVAAAQTGYDFLAFVQSKWSKRK
jgi:hypothetical protein